MSDAGVDAVVARARILVDDRFGVVRRMSVHQVGPSDPPLFVATAELASTEGFSDVTASKVNGGAALDETGAVLAALGESMERYALGLYRERELCRASFADLGPSALDPRRLVFFADEQYAWPDFPYAPYDCRTKLSWVIGTSLVDGRPRAVPAVRVFTPYHARQPEERILQPVSTGAACHVDMDDAVLAALYECIERDAVMIAWLDRLPLPALDGDAVLTAPFARFAALLEQRGCSISLLDATSDLGIPTVLAILFGRDGTTPAVAVGAATRATIAAAAEKALIESAHTFFWIRTRARDGRVPHFHADYADVRTLDQHTLLYGDPAMRDRVTFLSAAVPDAVRIAKARARELAATPGDGSARDALASCIVALRRIGADAVVVDLTPPDVRDLGFVVVRVVATDLHPLWGGHQRRCLGGTRIHTVPRALGYPDAVLSRALNSDPHPMP